MKIDLVKPAVDCRPVPFWSWNDKLDCDELRFQVREMHRAGLGGFFMHARGGLQTEYLSKEWMDCVCACVDEAMKLGMEAWLYDENGWPSGFSGGLVNSLGVDYQQKYLRCECCDAAEAAAGENTIAFYSCADGRLLGRSLPDGISGKVYRCFFEINPFYVDNLDPKVVAEFIRTTHERYHAELPPEIFRNIKGIFTDEPQLSRNGIPWSFTLEKEYARKFGSELLAELPKLFYEFDGSSSVRINFYSLCAKLFTVNFMKQLRDWCDAHGWLLTGHHVLEETCQHQINCNGSVMAQYRYYHIPGIDHLASGEPSQVAAVQLASSAAQFGQKRMMSESFAATGWACNFIGQRWIYQQQMAYGVNFLCQHLQSYSLKGKRKRDYPASFFIHQPWWDDYSVQNDIFARTGELLAAGRIKVDLLVLHPLSSAWKHYAGDASQVLLEHYTNALTDATRCLREAGVEHHYADEIICDECACVKGRRFVIGKMSYRQVLIPQISNISAKIFELLREFHRNGGKIYKVANQQHDEFTVGGAVPDAEMLAWYESLPVYSTVQSACDAVAKAQPNRVQAVADKVAVRDVIATRRYFSDLNGRKGNLYYLVNAAKFVGSNFTLHLPRSRGEAVVEELDLATGEFKKIPQVRRGKDCFSFECFLAAAGSRMFFVSTTAGAAALTDAELDDPALSSTVKKLSPEFVLTASTPNILTLDRARCRIDGGEWQDNDIISLQTDLLGMKKNCDVELEFDFELAGDMSGTGLFFAMELPERFTFALNGSAFEISRAGYIFDKAFQKVILPLELLRDGRNTLYMKTRFYQSPETFASIEKARRFESEYNKLTLDTELESIYLGGNFTVNHYGICENMPFDQIRLCGRFEVAPASQTPVMDIRELTTQGLPFFSGKLQFEQDFEVTSDELCRIRYLRMVLHGANSVKVTLNGAEAGFCAWEPFAFDVAGKLHPGVNHLTIEIVTSLQNTLGPHHKAAADKKWTSPFAFHRKPDFAGYPAPLYNENFCLAKTGITALELAGTMRNKKK